MVLVCESLRWVAQFAHNGGGGSVAKWVAGLHNLA